MYIKCSDSSLAPQTEILKSLHLIALCLKTRKWSREKEIFFMNYPPPIKRRANTDSKAFTPIFAR